MNIAVIGAGPAGLIAAALLAGRGESVTLIDEQAEIGGHLRYDRYSVGSDKHDSDSWRSELGRAVDSSGATVLQSAIAWAAFTVGDHFELAVNHAGAEQSVRADHLVLATGTTDLPLVIPGATLPGVMTSRAARILLNRHGVLPGQRLVIADAGSDADRLRSDLTAAGADASVIAPDKIAAVAGDHGVESMRLTDGSSIATDCLIVARGEAPDLQLAGMLEAPRIYDLAIEGWRLDPRADLPGVTVVGGALLGAASPDLVVQSAVEAVDRIAPAGPGPGDFRLDITDAILRGEAMQG
jgi:sarcosine oxidase subunit alpha